MIYMDYNATTPVDPRVLEAMVPFLKDRYGNPSSGHQLGKMAKEAVERARSQVASLLGARSEEIIFTSGGSESNNTVIQGVARAHRGKPRHIVTAQSEHPSVLEPCRVLEAEGVEVTFLPVDRYCRVDPEDVRRAIKPHTILVSIMHANNEVGTIQPISEISRIAREAGVLFHSDASQSVGKIPVKVSELGVDLLTVAGHKLYAPKGIGALYVREGVKIPPLIHGGSQEMGKRAGTESVPLVVGLGEACSISEWPSQEEGNRLRDLRDALHRELSEKFRKLVLNGHPQERLPNTLNVSFPGYLGVSILEELGEICASVGSACHEGSAETSPVLRAMGVPQEVAMGAIRFSLGRWSTQEEVDRVAEAIGTWAKGKRRGLKGWVGRLLGRG